MKPHTLNRVLRKILADKYPGQRFTDYSAEIIPVQKVIETRAVILHKLTSDSGETIKIIQKTTLNRPLFSRTSPELFFYEKVMPNWRAIQGHSPEFLGRRRNLLTTDLYVSYLDLPTISPNPDFMVIFNLIRKVQTYSWQPLAALPRERFPSYFARSTRNRFQDGHAPYLAQIAKNPAWAGYLPSSAAMAALDQNLTRLYAACQTMPAVPCHLDLLAKNILKDGKQLKLIDWGEFSLAPAGFEYGGLLALLFRRRTVRPFISRYNGFWANLSCAPDDKTLGSAEQRVMAAAYFFTLSILRNLTLSIEGETPFDPVQALPLFFEIIAPLLQPGAPLSAPVTFELPAR